MPARRTGARDGTAAWTSAWPCHTKWMPARATRDVPTNCDQHLPRATVNIDGRNEILPFPLSDPRCARGQDHWENSFDLDNGPLLGLNVGYAWRGLRLEAEYFYRQHGGDVSGLEITSGDKNDEFFLLRSGIGDVNGHPVLWKRLP